MCVCVSVCGCGRIDQDKRVDMDVCSSVPGVVVEMIWTRTGCWTGTGQAGAYRVYSSKTTFSVSNGSVGS